MRSTPLNDTLTLLFELRQATHIRNHFQNKNHFNKQLTTVNLQYCSSWFSES